MIYRYLFVIKRVRRRKQKMIKINNSTCLHPKCDREITTRGLCWTHYQTARRLVKRGLTTYDELIKNEKILPTNYKSKLSEESTWFLKTKITEEVEHYRDKLLGTLHPDTLAKLGKEEGVDL